MELSLTDEQMREYIDGRVTVRDIAKQVSAATGIEYSCIMGRDRTQPTARARALVCHLAREHGFSYTQIGRALSRDHTTIIHHVAQFHAQNASTALLGSEAWRV